METSCYKVVYCFFSNSIVLLPTESKRITEAVGKTLLKAVTLDFRGFSEAWVNKILTTKQQLKKPAQQITAPTSESSKNFCSNCGTKIEEGSKFYHKCGAPL
jgi:hypothetical protein